MSVLPQQNRLPVMARCRACGYRLLGLPTHICPECGQEFDPNDSRSYDTREWATFLHKYWARCPRLLLRLTAFAASVGFAWFVVVYREGEHSVFLWMPVLYFLVRKRLIDIAIFLLCTPVTASTVTYCRLYAHGGATYVRPAYSTPFTPQGNLNPVTRLRGFDPGCGTHSPDYWIRAEAQSLAACIMSHLIGPPPGAYLGPYPTLPECVSLLHSSGQPQTDDDIQAHCIRIGASAFRIPTGDIQGGHFVINRPDSAPWSAALYKQQCLVVRVPQDLSWTDYYLFDAKTGRGFAVYVEQHQR